MEPLSKQTGRVRVLWVFVHGSQFIKAACLEYDYTCFPGGSEVKESACNAGDQGLIPGSGRSSGEGKGNPLKYSCLLL